MDIFNFDDFSFSDLEGVESYFSDYLLQGGVKQEEDAKVQVMPSEAVDSPLCFAAGSPASSQGSPPPSPMFTANFNSRLPDFLEDSQIRGEIGEDLQWLTNNVTNNNNATEDQLTGLVRSTLTIMDTTPYDHGYAEMMDDDAATVPEMEEEPLSPACDVVSAAMENTCLTEDELVSLTVRDLNRRITNLSNDAKTKLKARRRTLKNRGYAQNCRTKRIKQQCELEKENITLRTEIKRLRMEVLRSQNDRDNYKRTCHKMQQFLLQDGSKRGTLKIVKVEKRI